MMKYYISGQITGCKDYMERFSAAEAYLKNKYQNALVFNPAKINSNMPKGAEYEDYMAVAMAILERCDNIYMLPGWEKSPGANREYGYAQAAENIWTYELTEENLEEGNRILAKQYQNAIRELEEKIKKWKTDEVLDIGFPVEVYVVEYCSGAKEYEAKLQIISTPREYLTVQKLFGKYLFLAEKEAKEVADCMNKVWGNHQN